MNINLYINEDELKRGFESPENYVNMIDRLQVSTGIIKPMTQAEKLELIEYIKSGGNTDDPRKGNKR